MARATSTEGLADAAATQRMAAPGFVDEPTAILEPIARADPPEASASTHRETPAEVQDALRDEPDIYRTASDTQPAGAASPSVPAEDPRTQPTDTALPATSDLPPTSLKPDTTTAPHDDGRRTPWLIGSVILVLLVLFVGGILLSQAPGNIISPQSRVTPAPAATSTATPALPAGYVRVEDASGLYSFALPRNWMPLQHSVANAEVTTYTDPSRGATFEVESFPATAGQSGAALDNRTLTGSFPAHALSNISTPVTTSLAGVTWIKESASLALQQNGTTQQDNLVVQTTTYNATTYIIFYSSPVAASVDADAQALPQILDSFTFLG
jgi:hypothetical protein